MIGNKRFKYFFSYKSEDIELVRRLCDRLYAEGIPVWLNEYHVKHNQQEQFQEFINGGIDHSEYGILFITENYADSPFCQLEVERLLRRLPIENIIPVVLEKSEKFNRLFPELSSQLMFPDNDYHAILEILRTFTNLQTKYETLFKPTQSQDEWSVIEAGFKFNPCDLHIKLDSKFTQTTRYDLNPGTGTKKEEYCVFTDTREKVELLFDYDFYESDYAEVVGASITRGDSVRILDNEQEERKRLKEEMEMYEDEVKSSLLRIAKSNRLEYINIHDAEEIGIHMLSTINCLIEYKHRMYTFRIKKLDRTYRMVKLVLPHPIHHSRAYLIRFIFSCKGSLEEFYYYVPLLNKILESFSWLKRPEINDEIFTKPSKLFKK